MNESGVELNFAYMFGNDAKFLAKKAKNEDSKLKSLFVRYAIIAVVFNAEAFINRIFDDFFIVRELNNFEKMGLKEKWLLAPLVCQENGNVTFDKSCDPYQSFAELIKIRNWFTHPKVDQFVPAEQQENSSITLENGDEVPWVEVLQGKAWAQTKIPQNPFELDSPHADKAMEIVGSMIAKLKEFMPDQVTEDWINKIKFRSKNQADKSKNLTMGSLWGGYTPDK